MKRVHQPEKDRSLAGSGYDSSDDDNFEAFCHSPEDDNQRQRICDLVALALASSRDHTLSQPQAVRWDADDSDAESHPSLKSDAEAELLELFDDDDDNESGCHSESSLSGPSVDGSFESYDATIIQNRKLPLLMRPPLRHQTALPERDLLCTNHANFLSPDLTILVERILNESQRTLPEDKKFPDQQSKFQDGSGNSERSFSNNPYQTRSKTFVKKDVTIEFLDSVEKNANVMEHVRKLVYNKYESSQKKKSETESIHSSILPVSPALLLYHEAFSNSCTHPQELAKEALVSTKPAKAVSSSSSSLVESCPPNLIACDPAVIALDESISPNIDVLKAHSSEERSHNAQLACTAEKVNEGNSSHLFFEESAEAPVSGAVSSQSCTIHSVPTPEVPTVEREVYTVPKNNY